MEEKKSASGNRLTKILVVVLVCVVVVMGVLVMMLMRRPDGQEAGGGDTPRIGYAEGVVAMDEDSLQKSIDEAAKVQEGRIALSYKNDAVSEDGKTFTCYIRNSPKNTCDEFVGIYSDPEYTDQLFLSELIAPGTGFEELTLDKTLDKGKNRVYVLYTQVKEEDGEQVMVGQVAVTMDFYVK